MIPEKEDNCPVCGKDLNQGEYDTQTCSDHWLYGKRIVEEPDRTLRARIRQLEDEVARLRAVNENARAERAFRLLEGVYSGLTVKDTEKTNELASLIVSQVVWLEKALAKQAEKEKANG